MATNKSVVLHRNGDITMMYYGVLEASIKTFKGISGSPVLTKRLDLVLDTTFYDEDKANVPDHTRLFENGSLLYDFYDSLNIACFENNYHYLVSGKVTFTKWDIGKIMEYTINGRPHYFKHQVSTLLKKFPSKIDIEICF